VLWLRWLLWCDVASLRKELLQVDEVQELEVLFVSSLGSVTMLEGQGDGLADTLHCRRRVVADDVVHLCMRWQVHWKYGHWCHVSVEENDILLRLNSVLETIRAGQVEDLILVGDLVEWVELSGESVSGVHSVLVGHSRCPRSISSVLALGQLEISTAILEFIEDGDL